MKTEGDEPKHELTRMAKKIYKKIALKGMQTKPRIGLCGLWTMLMQGQSTATAAAGYVYALITPTTID